MDLVRLFSCSTVVPDTYRVLVVVAAVLDFIYAHVLDCLCGALGFIKLEVLCEDKRPS